MTGPRLCSLYVRLTVSYTVETLELTVHESSVSAVEEGKRNIR